MAGGKRRKQITLSFLFGLLIVFVCFVGQDPPGLRTLGEVAPENIYSDRSFKYLSDVRRVEAEEWIRSSTPREFSRDFSGEERFGKAIIRLEEGLRALVSMDESSREVAQLSLLEEMNANFQLSTSMEEITKLMHWNHFSNNQSFFQVVSQILGQLHLVGVVKFPSNDQNSFPNKTRLPGLIRL